jgi:hypothetical protein
VKRLLTIFCSFIVLANAAALQAPAQAQSDACAKALAPHLKKGDPAQITKVSSKDIPGAFLKGDAGRAGPVLRYLPVGTVVQVVEGPKCGDDKGFWWQVKLGDLTGWMAEVSDKAYALEPSSGPASTPLPSTVARALFCIQPVPPAAANNGDEGDKVLRTVYGTLDGNLQVSDNGGIGRTLTSFSPPPLSVDLSPDGRAALVVTYNGLYWVDTLKGATVLIADAATLGLTEGAWPSLVTWLPDGRSAALEITDKGSDVPGYTVWNVALDGSHPPFQADTGAQAQGGIKRSPGGNQLVMLSANAISPFPKNPNDAGDPLLEYVPKGSESDPNQFVIPSLAWAPDGNGFYTFIPVSEVSGPDDAVGGKVWYIPTDGTAKDMGKPAKLKPTDYVIASPTGEAVIVGRGASWAIQNVKSGAILQTLPPVQILFGWTLDGKGAVFTGKGGQAQYLGIDGSTSSNLVPADATDLYDIKWLPDGTTFYVVRGKDGKLTFKVRRPGVEQDRFLGVIASVDAYSGRDVPAKTNLVPVPSACK